MDKPQEPNLERMAQFGLIEALLGRRSRRFFCGAEIPDGVFAHKSTSKAIPLSELERMLVVLACGGSTGWHSMIYRAKRYAPHLSNYSGSATGRTFPSAAGFETSKTFFTDDSGLYLLDVRDEPALVEPDAKGNISLNEWVVAHKQHCHKIYEGRLQLPGEVPYIEAHNTWVVNKPGTLLVIPVGDLSQHVLLNLCYMLQNGLVLYDDVNKRAIPGIEKFKSIVDIDNIWPLTFVEQWSLSEITTELSTSCYAGTLMLQAMGLGGWMFNGIDPFALFGANVSEGVKGLGFHCEFNDDWPYPHPTGLKGVMEGLCPPNYSTMREAVEVLCERKFGEGGPFHKKTPGPWKESASVRKRAMVHDDAFRECIAHQAQYLFDTFGKFPATVPAMFVSMFLQAHHLDLEFYDKFYKAGNYLETHKMHMQDWHEKT